MLAQDESGKADILVQKALTGVSGLLAGQRQPQRPPIQGFLRGCFGAFPVPGCAGHSVGTGQGGPEEPKGPGLCFHRGEADNS